MSSTRKFTDEERKARNKERVAQAFKEYRDAGLVPVNVWVLAADKERVKKYAQSLRTKAGIKTAKLKT